LSKPLAKKRQQHSPPSMPLMELITPAVSQAKASLPGERFFKKLMKMFLPN